MKSPDISIIIVNWNSRDYLQACLSSIPHSVGELKIEVIVIDSGSFDGSAELLSQSFPDVHFIQSHKNIGFARSNNLAAESANGNVLLFLNPDTELGRSSIVDLYTLFLATPTVGIIGCRLLNTDGTLQASCVQPMPTILNQLLDVDVFCRWFPRVKLWNSAWSYEGKNAIVPVEALSGACMMVTSELFKAINGFSTDYFMYSEDIDLCWKSRQAGFVNFYAPQVEILHHGGGSTTKSRSKFSDVMIPESVSRLLKKTRGNRYSTFYRIALSASALARLALLIVLLPAGAITLRMQEWFGSFKRWLAVLSWGLGFEKWAQQS